MGILTDIMAGAQKSASNGTANGSPSPAAAQYDLPSHFIGGSHLGVAQPGKVKDFVAAHGGHTVIKNVRDHPMPLFQRVRQWESSADFWGF
jgi:acetyl-CoA carboxylase/biotin carboxylase 1